MAAVASVAGAVVLALGTISSIHRGATVTRPAVRTSTRPPSLLFADADAGPTSGGIDGLGAPISIYGLGLGASRGTSTVTIGGVEVARYLDWGLANAGEASLHRIVVLPGPNVTSGEIVVNVPGGSADGLSFRPQSGAVYAVAPTGSDAGPCSIASPCATVTHAATRMDPGDTTLLRGGTYDEREIWIRDPLGQSGTPTARMRFAAYPGEHPVFADGARPFIVDANNVTVAGLTFTNGKGLVNSYDTPARSGNWIVDNVFTGAVGYEATGSHGDNHLLGGNVCHATGSNQGTQGHCYYISYGNGVRVLYNVGSGVPGYGIHVFDQQRQADDFRRTITNLTIAGNVLTGSTRRAGLILSMGDEAGLGNRIDGVTVTDNVFRGNDQLGAVVGERVANVTFTGNTFDENGNAGLYVGAGASGITVSGNTFRQSANSVCTIECTWYPTAHVIVVAGAGAVVDGNRYGPGSPVSIGTVDPNPGVA